jgi:hypothetical protein
VRGASHGRSKLTAADAREVRRLRTKAVCVYALARQSRGVENTLGATVTGKPRQDLLATPSPAPLEGRLSFARKTSGNTRKTRRSPWAHSIGRSEEVPRYLINQRFYAPDIGCSAAHVLVDMCVRDTWYSIAPVALNIGVRGTMESTTRVLALIGVRDTWNSVAHVALNIGIRETIASIARELTRTRAQGTQGSRSLASTL